MPNKNFMNFYTDLEALYEDTQEPTSKVFLYVTYQGDKYELVNKIYFATKNEIMAFDRWQKDVKAFHLTDINNIMKLTQAEATCTSAEADLILKGTKSVSTSKEKFEAEKVLTNLIKHGKVEELEVEYSN